MSWISMNFSPGSATSSLAVVTDIVAVAIIGNPAGGTSSIAIEALLNSVWVPVYNQDGTRLAVTVSQGQGLYRLPGDAALFGGTVRLRALNSSGSDVPQSGGLTAQVKCRRWGT